MQVMALSEHNALLPPRLTCTGGMRNSNMTLATTVCRQLPRWLLGLASCSSSCSRPWYLQGGVGWGGRGHRAALEQGCHTHVRTVLPGFSRHKGSTRWA
jgi:hypothetical protein